MGMYLMRQIGSRGVYGNPILPDFMVFRTTASCPGTGTASTFLVRGLMVLVVRAAGSVSAGWRSFRVTGVYLSIITRR